MLARRGKAGRDAFTMSKAARYSAITILGRHPGFASQAIEPSVHRLGACGGVEKAANKLFELSLGDRAAGAEALQPNNMGA